MINIAKILNDKYYTSPDLAEYCVNKTKEIIGEENITEYIEPSAGSGVFLDILDKEDKPYLAYDIEPEDDKGRIIKQDYLSLDLEYKNGRCIIGNPPFGFMTKLIIQFYKKSIQLGDYISFIMPVSFKDNIKQVVDFDLIYSEDLGLRQYSDRYIHCCLNIYKRPDNGLNKRNVNKIKLKDLEIIEIRMGNKKCDKYDYAICSWGSVGKEITKPNTKQYAKEFYIKIHNEKYKSQIIKLLKEVDWIKEYSMTATPNLLQWQVYKYIKEQIPEIE